MMNNTYKRIFFASLVMAMTVSQTMFGMEMSVDQETKKAPKLGPQHSLTIHAADSILMQYMGSYFARCAELNQDKTVDNRKKIGHLQKDILVSSLDVLKTLKDKYSLYKNFFERCFFKNVRIVTEENASDIVRALKEALLPKNQLLTGGTLGLSHYTPAEMIKNDVQFIQNIYDCLQNGTLKVGQKKKHIKELYNTYFTKEHNILSELAQLQDKDFKNLAFHYALLNQEQFDVLQEAYPVIAKSEIKKHVSWMLACICKSGNRQLLAYFLTKYKNLCDNILTLKDIKHIMIYAIKDVIIHCLKTEQKGLLSKKEVIKQAWYKGCQAQSCWDVFYTWLKTSKFYNLEDIKSLIKVAQDHSQKLKNLMINIINTSYSIFGYTSPCKQLNELVNIHCCTQSQELIDKRVDILKKDVEALEKKQ